MIIFIILALLWIAYLILKLFKLPKFDNILCVTGEIGTGKTFFNVYLGVKKWKKAQLVWKIQTFIAKLLKKELPEEPLLYSNMPLCDVPYVPITTELLSREKRFNYKSVVILDEVSLVQDSMTFKDALTNEKCQLFYKLFRHETRGGWIVLNTQSLADNHFAVKRSLSRFVFIHHRVKLPFITLLFVRELIYSADGDSVNSFNEDVEESLLRVVVPNRYYKMYDTYYLSALTDMLEREFKTRLYNKKERNKLKVTYFPSFRTFKTISQEVPE